MNSCHAGAGAFALAGAGAGSDGFIYSIFMDGSGNFSIPETDEFLDNMTAYTMGMTGNSGSEVVVNFQEFCEFFELLFRYRPAAFVEYDSDREVEYDGEGDDQVDQYYRINL